MNIEGKVITLNPEDLEEFLKMLNSIIPDEKPQHQHCQRDAIKDACAAFCDSFDGCDDCPYSKNIDADENCVISAIAYARQPVEAAISMAMNWGKGHSGKEEKSAPKTFYEDYASKHTDAAAYDIRNGIKTPRACRIEVYTGNGGKCPGTKPCWACWREEI